MNIAIIFRWPIRPNVEVVEKNIKYLLKQFDLYKTDTYLISWADKELFSLIDKKIIDNVIFLKEPTDEFISKKLVTKSKYEWSMFERSYKMFWSQKLILDFIKWTNIGYDYLVISRPDMKVDILDIKKCLSSEKYIIPANEEFIKNHKKDSEDISIVDVFAMWPFNKLDKVWNYDNLENLNRLYWESYWNWDMIKRMLIESKVDYGYEVINFILNESRHYKDKKYPFRYRQIMFNFIIKPITNLFWKNTTHKVAENIRKIFPAKAKDLRAKK